MLTNALGSNINIPNFILLPEDIADAVVYALGTPTRIEVSGINYMKFQTKPNIIILKYFCKCNKNICNFCLYFYFNSKFFFFFYQIYNNIIFSFLSEIILFLKGIDKI